MLFRSCCRGNVKKEWIVQICTVHFCIKKRGKKIAEDGTLLVTHKSTAEGFQQMNGGEYYVSPENLVENIQVGDIVTI